MVPTQYTKFHEESKELNNEHYNVLPAAGVRDGLGAPGARPVHTPAAQDHWRADDPYAKTGGYGRANHENHALRNSCDRSPVSRRQNSAVVHARRRQGRDLHTELQGRGGGSGPHRKPASLEGKPRGRAVHSGRATVAARNTIAREPNQPVNSAMLRPQFSGLWSDTAPGQTFSSIEG